MADDSPALDGVPIHSTQNTEDRLRVACMKNIIMKAARSLPIASGRFKYVSYCVNKTYTISPIDFAGYTRLVSHALQEINLRNECEMTIVRFYVCQHGLQLDKLAARRFVADIIDMDHPQMNIAQIHRADSL